MVEHTAVGRTNEIDGANACASEKSDKGERIGCGEFNPRGLRSLSKLQGLGNAFRGAMAPADSGPVTHGEAELKTHHRKQLVVCVYSSISTAADEVSPLHWLFPSGLEKGTPPLHRS